MAYELLERRADPRTQAYVPVTLSYHDQAGEETPAHLLDLSCGGAAVLTTAYNAPQIGQFLDLKFEVPNSDGGTESGIRQETGMVVQIRDHERGVSRIGIRFLQHREVAGDLFDPKEILTSYRRRVPVKEQGNRWQTIRNFERVCRNPAAALSN